MDDDTRSETSTHSVKGMKRPSMIKKQRESFDAVDVINLQPVIVLY